METAVSYGLATSAIMRARRVFLHISFKRRFYLLGYSYVRQSGCTVAPVAAPSS